MKLEELLHSREPQVAYNAAALLGKPQAARLRELMIADQRVRDLVALISDWPGEPIAGRRSARQYFHILAFLADIGLAVEDPGMPPVIGRIMSSLDEHSLPLLPALPPAEGTLSTGGASGWALCDCPTTLRALKLLGVCDPRLQKGMDHIASLVGTSGPAEGCGCVLSPSLAPWRGPGRKSDPCPYATLVVLRLLLLEPARYEAQIDSCARTLLHLWEHSRKEHPYMFGMGNEFRKLKLPMVWYDILPVAEALSKCATARDDPRFIEMLALIRSKCAEAGCIPESAYRFWKDFDFGQTKRPSDWMSLVVIRILGSVRQDNPEN